MMNQWHNQLAPTITLDGTWEFALGDQQGTLQVPGTWEAQSYDRHLDGPAHYRKLIYVPSGWYGQRVQLQFDAASYHVEAQVNGQYVGEHSGLWTPFAFDVTDAIRFGDENEISLTVYKPGERFPMRESLAGFLPDVCIPFGGLWQSARLVALPGPAISDLWLSSDAEVGEVHLRAELHHADNMTAVVRILSPDGVEAAMWRGVAAPTLDTMLTLNPFQHWHPDYPSLYSAEITIEDSDGAVGAQMQRSFGFRSLPKQGEQLLFNGVPICLRGVLDWGWYPGILCPAPDEATIHAEFRRARELGYNLIKLCLCVPSPLYFDIADQEGMFLWLELPLWQPQMTPGLRENIPIEYRDILMQAHIHPSIILYSLGCELGGSVDADLLSQLNDLLRSITNGVLVCDNSGSGEAYSGLGFDFADFNDYHFYCDLHYFNPLVDHFRRDWRPARPWIFGEFCDADDYRDLDEIAVGQGGMLPWWLTEKNPIHPLTRLAYPEQAERMAALDLGFDHLTLQCISRQQSLAVRKAILEKVRAHSSTGGYVVSGIRDTPVTTSGMFDDLGRSKYTSESFREFNADNVLLLEQGRKRVWTHGGDRPAPVDRFNLTADTTVDYRVVLAHSGSDLAGGILRWQLLDSQGNVIREGQSEVHRSQVGGAPREIASISFTTPAVKNPCQCVLTIELGDSIRNRWNLWIYPEVATWAAPLALYDPAGVLAGLDDLREAALAVTSEDLSQLTEHILLVGAFSPDVADFIRQGGRAVLLQNGHGSIPVIPCSFWREAINLLYDHPVLSYFPHQGYTDLQFYHLATDYALDTSQLKTLIPGTRGVTPIIRRLDAHLFTVADHLVELQIGAGRALASTLRFAGGAGDQVTGLKANIAGRYLLQQMLVYLRSSKQG